MAYINYHGFVLPKSLIDEELLDKIKTELFVAPEISFGNFKAVYFKVYIEAKLHYILPIHYALKLEIPFTVKFIKGQVLSNFSSCNITLRDSQLDCYNVCSLEKNKDFGGGIINLQTAAGKTVLALKLMAYFSTKSLVVVNKIELINQWNMEIKKFIPKARVGIIQGAKFDIIDKDIIIGTLQSISLKGNLKAADFKSIDTCFIDEIHNTSTESFSKIMFKVRPRLLFGLTATLERKDKMEKIIKWYIGDVIYSKVDDSKKQITQVKFYKYTGESSVNITLRDGTAAVSSMLSNIAQDTSRTNLIVKVLLDLIKDKDRMILVLGDRITQLKYINKAIGDLHSGLFIGGLTREQKDTTKTKQIILGTYAVCNEGFSLEKLNCLVFSTPRSSIVQGIGRIYRKHHTLTPIIIDFWDQFGIFKAQGYRRKKVYRECIENPEFSEEII